MSITNRDKAELGVEQNFLINGGGESGTAGWSTFVTTFTGGLPTTITPITGTSIISITSTTTNPLSGNESLVMNINAYLGSHGYGVISDPITLTDAYLAKVISVQFDYNFITNPQNVDVSGTSTQTVEVWFYNVGLGTWYQPAGFRSINTKGVTGALVPGRTPSITFQSDVSNASNKNQYRVAIVLRNDPAGNFSMSFDNFTFGRPTRNSGPAVTDWQDYTPIWTSTATPPSIGNGTLIGQWRRVGDSIELRTAVISGTTTTYGSGSGKYLFSLPSGISIDTNKIANAATAARPTYGTGFSLKLGGGNAWYNYTVAYETTTQFSLSLTNADNAGTQSAGDSNPVAPSASTANQEWRAHATFPVSGWSSDLQLSNDTDTRVVAAQVGLSANVTPSANTPIIFDAIISDTHSAYSISTGLYTVPVSGYYQIDFVGLLSSGSGDGPTTRMNGVALTALCSVTTGTYGAGSFVLKVNAGDTIGIYANNGGNTYLGNAAPYNTAFSINRLSGPSVIAANETVAAKYTATAGAAINNGTPNIYDTKLVDTHNQFNTSTGNYTVPVSGIYEVFGRIYSSTAIASYILLNGSIYSQGDAATAGAPGTISDIIPCIAGDILALSSNSSTTASGPNYLNSISIIRVGN